MNVLVTGGLGFIGSTLVPRLSERGEAVRVLDIAAPEGGDVRDPDAVMRAADGMDAVIHLAAAGNVPDSIADPVANFEVNARGTLNVLRAAQAAGVRRLVFASTGGALIGAAEPPVDEQSVPRPLSPYGASKLCGEGYLHAFRGSYGLDAVALRFANVYGPGSAHKKGAVTMFIKRSLRGEPLVIYGDGSASRDFVHVSDLCAGILAALDAPAPPPVIHLASGQETPILELARRVLQATGCDVPIEHRPARAGEVERNVAVTELAAEALGFRAGIGLAEGLADTVEWFRRTDTWRQAA